MRGTVAAIGIVLAVALGIRIVLGDLSDELSTLGFLLAALSFIGAVLVVPWPQWAVLPFSLAAILGLLAAGDTGEFLVWGGVALMLDVVTLFCARAKRRADRQAAETDAWIRQAVATTTPDLSPRHPQR